MPEIIITENTKYHPVFYGPKSIEKIGFLIKASCIVSRFAVITDTNVQKLWGDKFMQILKDENLDATLFTFEAGEDNKNLSTVEKLASEMIDHGFDRNSTIIALGGGVVGDIAGFLASIYYRGINVIQVPTTLLAQVDSAMGGKTGVNLNGKNLIGSFNVPRMVVIDPQFLNTLSTRVLREGAVEALKTALLVGTDTIKNIEVVRVLGEFIKSAECLGRIPDCMYNYNITQLIKMCVVYKENTVFADLKEHKDLRILLNLGHTIGHGIEAASQNTDKPLLHGEALAIGLRAALYISVKRGYLSQTVYSYTTGALGKYGLNMPRYLKDIEDSIDLNTIMDFIRRDKKFVNGKMRFVLVKGKETLDDHDTIGFVSEDVTEEEIIEAIDPRTRA